MKQQIEFWKIWLISGSILWLVLLLLAPSLHPKSVSWVKAILLLVPLVLAPLVLQLAGRHLPYLSRLTLWLYPGAVCFGLAFVLPQGILSIILAAIWLVTSLVLMAITTYFLVRHWRQINAVVLCLSSGFLFLPIGAFAGLIYQMQWQPLGFTPLIILLTAVHFHYAGFILPLLAGLILMHWQKPGINWIASGIIIGIPLVGLGITTSQLAWPPWIETGSVTVLVIAAILIGALQIVVAIQNQWPLLARVLLGISSGCLILGMILAMGYGWRHYFPISFLDIPWMYAVHGTLNSIGFAATGLVGWLIVISKKIPRPMQMGLKLGRGKG